MENAENTARLPSSLKRILWILLAVLIIFMNLLVDIAYKLVDPRINITKKGN